MCQRYLGTLPVSLCVTIHAVSTAHPKSTLGGPKSSFIKTTFKIIQQVHTHPSPVCYIVRVCVRARVSAGVYMCFCGSGSSQRLCGDINS